MKYSNNKRSRRKKFATLAVSVIVFFAAVGVVLPSDYSVIRIRYIKATPAVVAPYVNDLHKWGAWFPWKKIGKPRYLKFGDITSGVGANMSWVNDGGEGRVTLIKSSPEKGIDYKFSLNDGFYECDVALHHTEFKKGKTYVSWAVRGKFNTPIVGGYMALLMEPVVGAILNQGLKDLKKNVTLDIKKRTELEQSEEQKEPS